MRTLFASGSGTNPVPRIVITVPASPIFGVKSDIETGTSATTVNTLLLVAMLVPFATVMYPEVAPSGMVIAI